MEKLHNIVYKTTNLINGKIYIGVRSTNNLKDGYLGSGRAFKYSLQKHGKANFSREILFDFPTAKEAYDKEREIVTVDFVSRKDNYNLKEGGIGAKVWLGKKGELHPRFGNKATEKQKIASSKLRMTEDEFLKRINDIKNSDRKRGWKAKLARSWKVSQRTALIFIRRWHDKNSVDCNHVCQSCGNSVHRSAYLCKPCFDQSRIMENPFYSFELDFIKSVVWSEALYKIAKKYNTSESSIRRFCEEKNITTPPVGYWGNGNKKINNKK